MGFLDTIAAALPKEQAAAGQAGLPGALRQLIEHDSGGIGGLAERFRSAGLGQIVESWIGNGANRPVAPQEVGRALGDEQVGKMARQTGLSSSELLPLLARYLPTIVDRLTPQGKTPEPASRVEAAGQDH
jgi:uncharacterized protein YidB (DUF937 family)